MNLNIKFAERTAVLATLNPASVAPSTVVTSYVSVANHHSIAALIQTGVLGASATLNAQLMQAQDNAGTGAKVIGSHALTQIVQATGNNVQALIECRTDELDGVNGFSFVALSLTVGVAASLVSAALLGVNPRFASTVSQDQAGVVQIV